MSEKHLRALLNAAVAYVNEVEEALYSRRAATIGLWPDISVHQLHTEQFRLLQGDLESLGHQVVIEDYAVYGAGVNPDDLVWLPIYVWLAAEAGRIGRRVIDQVVGEITTAVMRRFGDRNIVERVTIYGPRDEILGEVDLQAARGLPSTPLNPSKRPWRMKRP